MVSHLRYLLLQYHYADHVEAPRLLFRPSIYYIDPVFFVYDKNLEGEKGKAFALDQPAQPFSRLILRFDWVYCSFPH